MKRQEVLSHLRENPELSVLIVGGGINGIAVFRELALNGVDVLLVERADFCSGGSTTSPRLLDSGLRHAETGELGLARESVRERDLLLQNAPHLVKPMPVAVPVFERFSGLLNVPGKFFGRSAPPAVRGALSLRLALMLQRSYAIKPHSMPRHASLSRKKAMQKWNGLHPGVVGVSVYQEGVVLNPERLAVEMMLDAEQENSGAHALNYMSMVGGMEDTIILRDELTDENFDIKPRLVINASGAWIDATNHKLGLSSHYVDSEKNSLIVVRHSELLQALNGHGFVFEDLEFGRVSLLPLQDRVLIGAARTLLDDPNDAACTAQEMDDLFDRVRRIFPDLNLARQHVVFHLSGVCPLQHLGAKTAPHAPGIEVLSGDWTNLAFPVHSLVGGTWTSFRAFAEQAADKAFAFLHLKRTKDTRSLAVGGGRGYLSASTDITRQIDSLAAWTGVARERLKRLFERYGTRAEAVATFMNGGTDRLLVTLPEHSLREMLFITVQEKVFHLDDLLLRRRNLALPGQVTREMLHELAGVLANALGWTKEQREAETARALSILTDRHGVSL